MGFEIKVFVGIHDDGYGHLSIIGVWSSYEEAEKCEDVNIIEDFVVDSYKESEE